MQKLIFDGLIGPTHNYGGLSLGNNASQDNSKQISSPKDAALQGLKKMKLLMEESIPQGIFLPHERPHLKGFSKLGFTGNIEKVLNDAYAVNPNLVSCFTLHHQCGPLTLQHFHQVWIILIMQFISL